MVELTIAYIIIIAILALFLFSTTKIIFKILFSVVLILIFFGIMSNFTNFFKNKATLECEQKNGIIIIRNNTKICNIPTQDAFKSCKDSNECDGLCILNETTKLGYCQEYTYKLGCFNVMSDGTITKLCID